MQLLCGLLTAVVHGSRFSSLANFRVSCALYVNRYPSAIVLVCLATCRRSAFLPTSASHVARSNCRSHLCSQPSLWPPCRSSPARTLPVVFHRCRSRTRSQLNTSAYRFLLPRFCPYAHVSVALVCHAITAGYARSLSGKAVWHSFCVTLLTEDAPYAAVSITRYIADDVEDVR